MTLSHDAAVEKIRKVLRLTASSNEHEAALAAETVQRLLAEYRVVLAEVSETEIGRTVIARDGGWADLLLTTVATACGCRALLHHGDTSEASVFGTWLDRRTAITLYRQVRPVIAARMADAWTVHVASLQGPFGPHPATTEEGAEAEWTTSYAFGAIDTLRKRLIGVGPGQPAQLSEALTVTLASRLAAREKVDAYVQQTYGTSVTKLPRHVVIDRGAVRAGEDIEL